LFFTVMSSTKNILPVGAVLVYTVFCFFAELMARLTFSIDCAVMATVGVPVIAGSVTWDMAGVGEEITGGGALPVIAG
jgi:hypothetical protein